MPDELAFIERAAATGGTVFVDFDETLLLANSTHLYIASAHPRSIAFLICKLVDTLRLWSLGPGPRRSHRYRDWLKVLFVTLVLPWTLVLWRRRGARAAAERHANRALIAALAGAPPERVCVITFGFRPVVAPMVAQLLPGARLIATGLFDGARLRRTGKLAAVRDAYDARTLARASLVTDSPENDADLIAVVERPVVVLWPDVDVGPPFADLYIPFYYTEKVKRAGSRYMLRGVLGQDVIASVLAFAWLAPSPLTAVAAAVVLHASLWSIYELGYYENDRFAATREHDGRVPERFAAGQARLASPLPPWTFAVLSGALGVGLAVLAAAPDTLPLAGALGSGVTFGAIFAVSLAAWISYLVVVRAAFACYNRTDPDTRHLLYPLLQVTRLCGCGLFFATNVAGVMVLSAFVFGRWFPYLVYRLGKRRWGEENKILVLFSFLALAPIALCVDGGAALVSVQSAVIVLWLAVRARYELATFVSTLTRPSDRSGPPPPRDRRAPARQGVEIALVPHGERAPDRIGRSAR